MRQQSSRIFARRVAGIVGAIVTLVTPSAWAQSPDVRQDASARQTSAPERRASARQTTPRQNDTVIRVEIPMPDISDIMRDVNRIVQTVTKGDMAREIRDAVRDVTRAVGRFDFDDVRLRERLRDRDGNAGDWGADQDRNFRAEQTDRSTKTLALGATGSLELRNLVGDITVTAGGGRDATIEIIRRSRGQTDADAKQGLERVTVSVDQRGERATVQSNYPTNDRRPPYSVSVSYVVTAPAGTRVTASTTSGNLTFKNIKGDISANVTSGDVIISGAEKVSEAQTISGDISLTDVSSDEGISVGTISGTVTLLRVKARSVNADVTSGDIIAREMAAGAVDLKCLSGSAEYAGTLAKGGRYSMQGHSGNLKFLATGGTGFDLRASTFSGEIKQEPGLDLKGATSSRRSLRGTVGDGSAVVSVTTFSGNVTVGKR